MRDEIQTTLPTTRLLCDLTDLARLVECAGVACRVDIGRRAIVIDADDLYRVRRTLDLSGPFDHMGARADLNEDGLAIRWRKQRLHCDLDVWLITERTAESAA